MRRVALLTLFVVFSLGGCISPPGELPMAALQDLDTAIHNWNQIYGTNVQATGYFYRGRIDSVSELNETVTGILDPDRAWIPDIDVNNPASADAKLLSELLPQIRQEALESWESMVRSKVQVGLHIVQINWRKGSETFTTTCVTNDSTIVYDNMLSNAVLVRASSRRDCEDLVIEWLWGGERGRITASLRAVCTGGKVINCERNCSANMSLGSAQVNCKTRVMGNCCILDYSWAWGTPLVWITVKGDNFTLETSGIGSSGEGSGSCTDCCYEEGLPVD